MESQAGIGNRMMRSASAFNNRITPFFGPIYTGVVCSLVRYRVAELRKEDNRREEDNRKKELLDAKLSNIRYFMRFRAEIDHSASNFEGNASFAHYCAGLDLIERSMCRGVYAPRCEQFKKEFSQKKYRLIDQKKLRDQIRLESYDLSRFRAYDKNQLEPEFYNLICQVEREFYLANPTAYMAGRKAAHRAQPHSSVTLQILNDYSHDRDTEEEVAAAEARLKEKLAQEKSGSA
jgi:hypothetical protein